MPEPSNSVTRQPLPSRAALPTSIVAIALGVAAIWISFAGRTHEGAQSITPLQRILDAKAAKASYIVYPPTVVGSGDPSNPTGFLIDVMNEIGSRAGIAVRYEPTTFDDFKAALGTGRCDIVVAGIFQNVPRARDMAFTRPVMYWAGVTAIAQATHADSYASLKDLDRPSVRVAVTAGTAEHDFVKRHLRNAAVDPRPDSDISLTLSEVVAGRADVAFADATTVRKFLKDKPDLRALFGGRPFDTYATCFVVRHGDADWLDFINASIETLQLDGTIAQLSAKWGGEDLWFLPSKPWE